jgi:hypothetical protein
VRDLAIIVLASSVLVLLVLRLAMAALDIATWTVGWRVVAAPTGPLVAPLESIEVLTRTPVGRMTLADVLASAVLGVLVMLMFASLTIRRGQH